MKLKKKLNRKKRKKIIRLAKQQQGVSIDLSRDRWLHVKNTFPMVSPGKLITIYTGPRTCYECKAELESTQDSGLCLSCDQKRAEAAQYQDFYLDETRAIEKIYYDRLADLLPLSNDAERLELIQILEEMPSKIEPIVNMLKKKHQLKAFA